MRCCGRVVKAFGSRSWGHWARISLGLNQLRSCQDHRPAFTNKDCLLACLLADGSFISIIIDDFDDRDGRDGYWSDYDFVFDFANILSVNFSGEVHLHCQLWWIWHTKPELWNFSSSTARYLTSWSSPSYQILSDNLFASFLGRKSQFFKFLALSLL